jgi:hypothetical protein
MGVVVEEVLPLLVLPRAGKLFLLGREVEVEVFFFLEAVEVDAESLVRLPPIPLHRLLIFLQGERSAFVAPEEGDERFFFKHEEGEEANFFLVP